MTKKLFTRRAVFFIFFLSGFCSLLYQIVWLRLAYASFGINTQVMSVVISIFMVGLALGSWVTGRWLSRTKFSPLYLYVLAELGIGAGALLVPQLFLLGSHWLLQTGGTDSLTYLIFSALLLSLFLLPWCFLMGATIPLMIAFYNRVEHDRTIFSFLYLANTLGAIIGTMVTVMALIELYGLNLTLKLAAGLNILIVIITLVIIRLKVETLTSKEAQEETALPAKLAPEIPRSSSFVLLFITGFCSMGLEVVWTRTFTPIIWTTVYSFASILILYLIGTSGGLWLYRFHLGQKRTIPIKWLVIALASVSFGQIVLNDPRLSLGLYAFIGTIFIFAFLLGYLTSKQIDSLSGGQAQRAASAYAINIMGCIAGPLVASYILLPLFGAKVAMIIFGLPFLIFLWTLRQNRMHMTNIASQLAMSVVALLFLASLFGTTYEEGFPLPTKIIKRDYNATVVAYTGKTDRQKQLLINGVGITHMTPLTKIMAHLPLALASQKPNKVLNICLGMGTTFRSARSWGVDTTAVELTPSVKELFPYFFADADKILGDTGRIVIDDGRRYLQRKDDLYDMITIDPPPPVQAAGSSLLYSEDFYRLAKMRLTEKGILQQWFPGDKSTTLQAVARALANVFPYVDVYPSIEGWGYHFIASKYPLETLTPEEFVAKLSPEATKDFVEWNTGADIDPVVFAQNILSQRQPITDFLSDNTDLTITDIRPYNEYYLLRGLFEDDAL